MGKSSINRFSVGFGILGLVCMVAGFAWVYRPLGFVVAGVELLALSILSIKRDN
jgi:hypothetical protein